MKATQKYILAFVLLAVTVCTAQRNKQQELEEQRQAVLSQIKQIEAVLFKTRGEKKSVLTEVEDINKRISARENLIRVTNQQANYLTRNINANMSQIEQLRAELTTLKEDYAAMIQKSYKSKSQQSRVMFLLSSESFLQAYKRVQYMKQYAAHRRKQGESIKEKTLQIQEINKGLIAQRKQKDQLIAENKKAKQQLETEQKQQQALVATLKKNESSYASQIRAKQKEADRLDKEIDALVRAAIAKSNKAAGETTKNTTTRARFAMTPEAKLVAAGFTSNKGKLPWPVAQGVVVGKYGTHRHPTLPNVTRSNSGVEIATSEHETVRAVFDGEVMEIQQLKGSNKAIMIRHGNFITVYSNLSSLTVKKGDKVATKQPLGQVSKNAATGKYLLKFYIYKDDAKMNPAEWVYQM